MVYDTTAGLAMAVVDRGAVTKLTPTAMPPASTSCWTGTTPRHLRLLRRHGAGRRQSPPRPAREGRGTTGVEPWSSDGDTTCGFNSARRVAGGRLDDLPRLLRGALRRTTRLFRIL